MPSWQLLAPMPDMTLAAGATLTFEAIDPDTGAAVANVTVSQAALYGVNEDDQFGSALESPLPVFVPIPPTEEAEAA